MKKKKKRKKNGNKKGRSVEEEAYLKDLLLSCVANCLLILPLLPYRLSILSCLLPRTHIQKKRKILLCVSSSLFSCFSKRVNVVHSYEFSFEIFLAQDAGVMNAAEIISFFILPPDFFDCEWWSWTVIGGRGRRHVTLILL